MFRCLPGRLATELCLEDALPREAFENGAPGPQDRGRTLGATGLKKEIIALLGYDFGVPTAISLDRHGRSLIKPFCPPHYASMKQAVTAFVDRKYGPGRGIFRNGGEGTAWREGAAVQQGIQPYSGSAISASTC